MKKKKYGKIIKSGNFKGGITPSAIEVLHILINVYIIGTINSIISSKEEQRKGMMRMGNHLLNSFISTTRGILISIVATLLLP